MEGVEVLGMENGGSGLEDVAGDIDGGHAASDDAVSLEDSDAEIGMVGTGVEAEEVGERGASDAGADDADGGGLRGRR